MGTKRQCVGVVGAGSFGTTVATLLAANTNVLLFSRKKELVDKVNLTHEHLGVVLNPAIRATNSLEEICAECSLIFPVVPSESFRKTIQSMSPLLKPSHILIHGTKGIDVTGFSMDELLYGKRDWLNITSFAIRAVIFFGITLSLLYFWWKNLNEQDTNPSMKLYDKSRAISGAAILLISMGVNPFGTWDWAMSIQPHWYSTLYAWYLMASGAVSMFSLTMLLIIYLKKRNNLALVNESHRHDVGKFMFAISVFWTYLFFSQFMLIWYANIPEETMYFDRREAGYFIMFWGSFIVCFILPFFILMRRGSKRNSVTTQVMAYIIIFGHWLDFFLVVSPELVPTGGFGFLSIGAMILLGSVYMYVIFTALGKFKDLESSTHPFYSENIIHQI